MGDFNSHKAYSELFCRLYEQYWEKVYLQVYRVVKDKDDTHDIVQDIFTDLWENRNDLQEIRSMDAYLYCIARRKTIRYVQLNLTRNRYIESLTSFIGISSHAPARTLELEMDGRELEIWLEKEIDRLPPRMKTVLTLSRKEHLSHREIALQLNISDKTVKKQIQKSISHLREKLASRFFSIIPLLFFWS